MRGGGYPAESLLKEGTTTVCFETRLHYVVQARVIDIPSSVFKILEL